MTRPTQQDWNPGAYGRFRDFRLRPALDLLARIDPLPEGEVVDLGCGAGAMAEALTRHFADRALIGVDKSAAMIAAAEETGGYARLIRADIANWQPERAPALIFSNAALHWLGDHQRLLPRLARLLAAGGTLAVQMPAQHDAPSHVLLRETAAAMFPDRFDLASWHPPVARIEDYARLLAPLGAVDAWETRYAQRLAPRDAAHPVRQFTQSTAMRAFLAKLSEAEAAAYVAAYEHALAEPYPPEPDGSVLFPFRRVFFVLVRDA